MLSFLYVYSDHSILECYNLFSGVELSMRSFFVIIIAGHSRLRKAELIALLRGDPDMNKCWEISICYTAGCLLSSADL